MRHLFNRISGQLVLLVLGTALPLIGVIVFSLYTGKHGIEVAARNTVREIAQRVAQETDVIDERTRYLAAYLAKRPLVRAMDSTHCDSQIAELSRTYPVYATVILTDLKGKVVCWSNPKSSAGTTYTDRRWFQDALKGKFGWGQPVMGKAARQWVITLTHPVLDEQGRTIGIITMGMSMGEFSRSVKWPLLSTGSVVSIQDQDGIFLARSLEPEKWVGLQHSHVEFERSAVEEHPGPDNVRRIYAHLITPVGWHVLVGIPPEGLFSEFRDSLIISLFVTLLGLILALAVAAWGARKIARPISELAAVAGAVTQGRMDARVAGAGPAEIAEVAGQFNAMVEALQKASASEARQMQRLQEINQELEAFSYSVSHDLRTPLRAIDGFSRLLMKKYDDTLDDEGKRLLHVVRDNTAKMGQLIDDILAFSRAGRLDLKKTEVDMAELALSVWQELQENTGQRDIRFEVKELPKVSGDPAMLHQVLQNLLSNAVKFTRPVPSAAIEVGCTSTAGEHLFYVKDNGVGFDPAYTSKLFGVFQRLHGVEEFEGTGIGLAIVKRIIARHGGHVRAEGNINQGATMYFALPTEEKTHV